MRRNCFLFLLLGFCVSASYAGLISPIEVYVGQETTLTLRITNTGNVPLEELSARIESGKVPQWLKQTPPEVVKSTQPQQVAHLPLRLSIFSPCSNWFPTDRSGHHHRWTRAKLAIGDPTDFIRCDTKRKSSVSQLSQPFQSRNLDSVSTQRFCFRNHSHLQAEWGAGSDA